MMKHPRFLKNQVRLEIEASLKTFMPLDLLTTPWFVLEVRGHSRREHLSSSRTERRLRETSCNSIRLGGRREGRFTAAAAQRSGPVGSLGMEAGDGRERPARRRRLVLPRPQLALLHLVHRPGHRRSPSCLSTVSTVD